MNTNGIEPLTLQPSAQAGSILTSLRASCKIKSYFNEVYCNTVLTITVVVFTYHIATPKIIHYFYILMMLQSTP